MFNQCLLELTGRTVRPRPRSGICTPAPGCVGFAPVSLMWDEDAGIRTVMDVAQVALFKCRTVNTVATHHEISNSPQTGQVQVLYNVLSLCSHWRLTVKYIQ